MDVEDDTFEVEHVFPDENFSIDNPDSREINHLAVWTVSSAKEGNGVHQLLGFYSYFRF